MSKNKKRVIAFYLPQFYPTPENDEWWEPGFTEWTNVARATPLFKGHYQPRIPRDLNFYDLRVPATREKQAQMASDAGIEGFCYWHYWFGNGKRLLSDVFREVVESGKPDFPFCLCWANHSWYQKTWDPTKPDKLLMEQTYSGEDDYKAHFMEMLPAFKDKRYIKLDGKLLFGIFDPVNFSDFRTFKRIWNELAYEYGIGDFSFFGFCQGEKVLKAARQEDYDLFVYDTKNDSFRKERSWINNKIYFWKNKILRRPQICKYSQYVEDAIRLFTKYEDVIPCIIPDFDHTPRSDYRGTVLWESTPEKWKELIFKTNKIINSRNKNLIFIKAWNEWAEGNYLEPDRRWGKKYLDATSEALFDCQNYTE